MAFGIIGKKRAKSDAERKRDMRNRDRLIEYADPEDAERRAGLESDPAAWLAYYLPDRFPLPFGVVHHAIIKACIRAMTQGTSITVAAPRGFGKTALLWGLSLYGVLTGLCRFPVVIGWKANAGLELLDQWLQALSENERLLADYPSVCRPFQESTASNRLKTILRSIEPEQLAGCNVKKVRGLVVLPDVKEAGRTLAQCALSGASMNGSIKGLNIGMLSGESLRPDIVLLDDPQDEQTADSEMLVKKVIKKIDYGIRSLAGPRRRLTVMATVTCVNPGDVSEHLLTRPGTEAIKTGQIITWPDGWHDEQSTTRRLWDEWNQERLRGLGNLDGGKAARKFYKDNGPAMTAGMTVSWEHRFHASDGVRVGDPDALYAAMWDFYDLGEMAFMAERQNAPIKEGVTLYNLTPKLICSRVDPTRKPGAVPEWVRSIIAATDINRSYALSTAIVGFGADQRAAVLWYGTHRISCDDSMTPAQIKAEVFKQLTAHGNALAALPCVPQSWVIDGGGTPQGTVIEFSNLSARLTGIPAMCAFGRDGKSYRPFGGKNKIRLYEQCHLVAESAVSKWIIWNAHYWMEQAQRAWTGTPGAPGSCELPTGHHDEFAEQICREQLQGKAEIAGRMVWIYNTQPGGPHDYADVMAMAFMCAAVCGIGTGGSGFKAKKYVERRKPKVRREDI